MSAERHAGPPEHTPDFSVGLRTATQPDQDIALLTVRGEIDAATAPILLEALRPVLDRDTRPVVLDLLEVAFMDSTGVHALVDAHRRLTPQNRRLAIACHEGGQIHRLLALVRLLDTLTVHRTRDSALSGGEELIRPGPPHNSRPRTAAPRTQSPAVDPPSQR